METSDSYGFPFPSTQVQHRSLPVFLYDQGCGIYALKLPTFNFSTYSYISDNNYDNTLLGMPPGGFLTTFANPLPKHLRPLHEQTWEFSANDAYLQNFSYSNPVPPNIVFQGITNVANSSIQLTDLSEINQLVANQPLADTNTSNPAVAPATVITSVDYVNGIVYVTPPPLSDGVNSTFVASVFPTPIGSFDVSINTNGRLIIKANGRFAKNIPPGPHTLLGKAVLYEVPDCPDICPADNFVIQRAFTDLSQFQGPLNLNTGIRDTHVHDVFEDVIAYAWSGNSNFVELNQQSNGVTNVFVRIGKINGATGKIRFGPVQQLTDIQPLPTIPFTGTVSPGSNVISNVANASELIPAQAVTDPNNSFPEDTYIVQISGTTVTVSAPSLVTSIMPVAFIASQLPGFSNGIFDTSIAIDRTDKRNIVVAYGYFNGNNFLLASAGVPNLPINEPTVQVSTHKGKPKSWSAPINIDPSLVAFESGGANDCRGIIADRYGNLLYSINSLNYLTGTSDFSLYLSADKGFTWTRIFVSTQGLAQGGNFDFPQVYIGNSGDPANPYGLFVGADFGSFSSLNVDTVPYLGYIPLFGLNGYGTCTLQQIPLLDNNVEHVCLTGKADGTVFLMYQKYFDNEFDSNGFGSSVAPHLLVIKPPGAFTDALLNVQGPYTSFQHVNDYVKGVNSYPQPGFGYPPLTIQSTAYDNRRKALYFAICHTLSWYNADGTVNQDFELFLIISVDNGTTWSRKFPFSTTVKNNRGFQSIMLDERNHCLYGGWYDSRKSLNSTQIQFYGCLVNTSQLDKWTDIARQEAGTMIEKEDGHKCKWCF